MKIFSKKSFIFKNGEEEAHVRNHEFAEVPDWAAKTKLFKLAEKEGSIQVIESSKQQKKIEKDGTIKETPAKK